MKQNFIKISLFKIPFITFLLPACIPLEESKTLPITIMSPVEAPEAFKQQRQKNSKEIKENKEAKEIEQLVIAKAEWEERQRIAAEREASYYISANPLE